MSTVTSMSLLTGNNQQFFLDGEWISLENKWLSLGGMFQRVQFCFNAEKSHDQNWRLGQMT